MSDADKPAGYGPLPPEALVDPARSLQRGWRWLVGLGALLLVGGTFAIAAPVVATVAVTLLVGLTILAAGVVQLIHVFDAAGWQARLWSGIAGVIYVVGGLLLLFKPLAGIVALTLVMIISLFVDGVFRVVMGLQCRPERGWGWLAAGGVVTVVLSVLMFGLFPGISLTLLGLLAGISLIFEGWSFIFLGLAARRAGEAMAED